MVKGGTSYSYRVYFLIFCYFFYFYFLSLISTNLMSLNSFEHEFMQNKTPIEHERTTTKTVGWWYWMIRRWDDSGEYEGRDINQPCNHLNNSLKKSNYQVSNWLFTYFSFVYAWTFCNLLYKVLGPFVTFCNCCVWYRSLFIRKTIHSWSSSTRLVLYSVHWWICKKKRLISTPQNYRSQNSWADI